MEEHFSMSRVLHYTVGLLLLAGVVAYWWMQPSGLNPMADPAAAEAMALVQTHRAAQAQTLLQALNNRAKDMRDRGIGVRLGEWQVQRERPDLYLVKTFVREQGAKQWFEREYIWEVDLAKKTIVAVSLPAIDLMPQDEKGPAVGPPGIPQL
jgi:hypothetical protein